MRTKPLAVYCCTFLIVLVSSCGCTSNQEIELARSRGLQAGYKDGRRDGELAAITIARETKYKEELSELESVGEYHLQWTYMLPVLLGAFVFGFAAQWVGSYGLRRVRLLEDIDWMILPPAFTQLKAANESETRHLGPPIACLLLLLVFIGCGESPDSAWQKGYEGAYRSGYNEGWAATNPTQEGASQGFAAAHVAALSGSDWHLYAPFAVLFSAIGFFVGIFVQYMAMLNCREYASFPAFLSIVLVPAMRHSLTYQLFEKRRELMIAANNEIKALALARELKIAQIAGLQKAMTTRIIALASLDEFSQSHLMALATQEMDRIMAESEQAATKTLHEFTCPHCAKQLAYPAAKAGARTKCPHKDCRRSITLP